MASNFQRSGVRETPSSSEELHPPSTPAQASSSLAKGVSRLVSEIEQTREKWEEIREKQEQTQTDLSRLQVVIERALGTVPEALKAVTEQLGTLHHAGQQMAATASKLDACLVQQESFAARLQDTVGQAADGNELRNLEQTISTLQSSQSQDRQRFATHIDWLETQLPERFSELNRALDRPHPLTSAMERALDELKLVPQLRSDFDLWRSQVEERLQNISAQRPPLMSLSLLSSTTPVQRVRDVARLEQGQKRAWEADELERQQIGDSSEDDAADHVFSEVVTAPSSRQHRAPGMARSETLKFKQPQRKLSFQGTRPSVGSAFGAASAPSEQIGRQSVSSLNRFGYHGGLARSAKGIRTLEQLPSRFAQQWGMPMLEDTLSPSAKWRTSHGTLQTVTSRTLSQASASGQESTPGSNNATPDPGTLAPPPSRRQTPLSVQLRRQQAMIIDLNMDPADARQRLEEQRAIRVDDGSTSRLEDLPSAFEFEAVLLLVDADIASLPTSAWNCNTTRANKAACLRRYARPSKSGGYLVEPPFEACEYCAKRGLLCYQRLKDKPVWVVRALPARLRVNASPTDVRYYRQGK